MSFRIWGGALFCCLIGPVSAWACIWDVDTVRMEKTRFPGVLELITGRFVRHSREYYVWRVADRQRRLKNSPQDPVLIDDLAVAYDKLGQPREGIPLLEACLEHNPDRYETIANLGTLYIHAGELERGAALIERAIQINPAAHFNREKYQRLMVRYIQQSPLGAEGVLSLEKRDRQPRTIGFAQFVLDQQPGIQATTELPAALKGVMGILHFGNFQSPIVLEMLGDLLLASGDTEGMAARAYLRAAANCKHPRGISALEQMASEASNLNGFRLRTTRDKLKNELAAAETWFKQIMDDEKRWIATGGDVDQLFSDKYYVSLEATIESSAILTASEQAQAIRRESRIRHWTMIAIASGILAVPAGILCMSLLHRGLRQMRSRANPSPLSTPLSTGALLDDR